MPTNSQHRYQDLVSLESLWERVRGQLEDEQHRIYEEIKHYPRPIPACDLQFNFLLEERRRVAQELDRLAEASQANLGSKDSLDGLSQFIRSSGCLGAETKRWLETELKEAFSRLTEKEIVAMNNSVVHNG